MTLGMLNQDLNDTLGKYRIRRDGVSVNTLHFHRKAVLGLVLGLCLFGSPIGALADDQPQELPKPIHKTTPPLFQEWQFDKSALEALPEGFSQEVGGQHGKGGWLVSKDPTAPSHPIHS